MEDRYVCGNGSDNRSISRQAKKTVEPVYMSEAVCATTYTDYCVMGAGAKGVIMGHGQISRLMMLSLPQCSMTKYLGMMNTELGSGIPFKR